jgi:hypothetical protein
MSQLITQLNNPETNDCFVNSEKIQGFNYNFIQGKIKKIFLD